MSELETARDIAVAEGLHYVYIGNVSSEKGQNTYCPKCERLLIERSGYTIIQNQLIDGYCPYCQTKLYGVWR